MFFLNSPERPKIYTLSLHDALPIYGTLVREGRLEELIALENKTELVVENASEDLLRKIDHLAKESNARVIEHRRSTTRSEEHTSELQSHSDLVCRLLLEKKKKKKQK